MTKDACFKANTCNFSPILQLQLHLCEKSKCLTSYKAFKYSDMQCVTISCCHIRNIVQRYNVNSIDLKESPYITGKNIHFFPTKSHGGRHISPLTL